MNKDETISHTEQRKNLWSNAWVHTASASDCKSYQTASKWADEALKAFDERFAHWNEITHWMSLKYPSCKQPIKQ